MTLLISGRKYPHRRLIFSRIILSCLRTPRAGAIAGFLRDIYGCAKNRGERSVRPSFFPGTSPDGTPPDDPRAAPEGDEAIVHLITQSDPETCDNQDYDAAKELEYPANSCLRQNGLGNRLAWRSTKRTEQEQAAVLEKQQTRDSNL
jgi:hypothetical protein